MNFCTMAWFTARPIQATVFPRTTDQKVILSKGEGLNLKIYFALKMTALWDIAPSSLSEVDQRFTGAYCFHHHRSDDGGCTHLWNVGIIQRDYTTLYPRKLSFSYSQPWEPEITCIAYIYLFLWEELLRIVLKIMMTGKTKENRKHHYEGSRDWPDMNLWVNLKFGKPGIEEYQQSCLRKLCVWNLKRSKLVLGFPTLREVLEHSLMFLFSFFTLACLLGLHNLKVQRPS
jgi:hypothetical protein